MTEEFPAATTPSPFHSDCYILPRVAVFNEDEAAELNVHCIRDEKRREFWLLGFIGVDREEQISQAIYLAKEIGGEVIQFKGVGFNDQIIAELMARMTDMPDERPGQQISLLDPGWPTRFQYRVMREAMDMSRHGDFHEESLAYRMHAPVEEIRKHLRLLADLGLMEWMGEN